jgi:gamma-glutamyltranspeptidase/glutathione hydrolase
LDDLRGYRPYWQETQKISIGDHTVHFSPPPASAGTVAAVMLDILANKGLYLDADGDVERLHALAEASMLSYADRSRWMLDSGETRWSTQELSDLTRLESDLRKFSFRAHMPSSSLSHMPVRHAENPSGTSFVTVDKDGGAVACSLTMNNLFGTGRIAPGTGIVLATIPDGESRGPYSLGPMIMDNQNSKKFFWAGASSGGVAAPTSLINVAVQVLLGNSRLSSAIAAKRIHHDAFPDTTYYEEGMEQWIVDGLVNRGHDVVPVSTMGRVNVVHCSKSLPEFPETCEVASDPRGFGLATMSQ